MSKRSAWTLVAIQITLLLLLGIGVTTVAKVVAISNIEIQQSNAEVSRTAKLDARKRELKKADATLANLESSIRRYRNQNPDLENKANSLAARLRELKEELSR